MTQPVVHAAWCRVSLATGLPVVGVMDMPSHIFKYTAVKPLAED
jgi:hypothetical protein